jgi:hypothetical protein
LIIWCIPGIFGFLVWELKENWRLYAANRPKGLIPMIIGSHGETMGRLLRPGFHSGTIPKLFAKLRRAERKARKTGDWKIVRKHLHGFEHIEESIRRFIERDFLALWNGVASLSEGEISDEPRAVLPLSDLPAARREPRPPEDFSSLENTAASSQRLGLQEIQFGTNRVRLVFSPSEIARPCMAIDFEVQSGWLVGDIETVELFENVPERNRDTLATAILGLYKTAGADIVRRQLEAALPVPLPVYDLSVRGLRIWPDGTFETEVFYEFGDAALCEPRVSHGHSPQPMPVLDRADILFREFMLPWENWVAFWDAAKRGNAKKDKTILVFSVLPEK